MNSTIKIVRNLFIAAFCMGAAACVAGVDDNTGEGQDALEAVETYQTAEEAPCVAPADVDADADGDGELDDADIVCVDCSCDLTAATTACRVTWPGSVAKAVKGNTCKSSDCDMPNTVGCGGTIKCIKGGKTQGELPGGNNGRCL